MFIEIWKNAHASVCSIGFLNQNNERIGSGTGFKIGNFIVTNNHVFAIQGAISVEIHFVKADGFTIQATKRFTEAEFKSKLIDALPETSWDFAILSLDDIEFNKIPSLKFAKCERFPIGSAIAVLGYQFDQANLSINQGLISSYYSKASVNYIQVDASVNSGNSGGPLIHAESGLVIGIITRKHTGLTEAFDKLMESYDHNIVYMQPYLGSMRIGGLDHIEVLIAGQNQMKIVANEISRSANVGIGLAYELDKINDFLIVSKI